MTSSRSAMVVHRISNLSSKLLVLLCCIIAVHRLVFVSGAKNTTYLLNTLNTTTYLLNTLKNSEKMVIMSYCERSGSSDSVAMFLQEMGVYQGFNYTGFVHDYQNENWRTFTILYQQVTLSMLMSSDWYKFKVVRNPYSRMVSSYFQIMF